MIHLLSARIAPAHEYRSAWNANIASDECDRLRSRNQLHSISESIIYRLVKTTADPVTLSLFGLTCKNQ